jgi:hypothetical protein
VLWAEIGADDLKNEKPGPPDRASPLSLNSVEGRHILGPCKADVGLIQGMHKITSLTVSTSWSRARKSRKLRIVNYRKRCRRCYERASDG